MGGIDLVSFSTFSHLIYSLLVFPEEVKSKECLSVQLWDSDRLTADDMVGKVEFDLHDLLLNGGKMESRVDKLAGDKNGSKMPGELHWEVGYFAKADFNKDMQTHGKDIRIPAEYGLYWIVLSVGSVISRSSKIPKANWPLKSKRMLFIRRLIRHFLLELYRSSFIRSSILRLKISQVHIARIRNTLLDRRQARTRKRKQNTCPARIARSC